MADVPSRGRPKSEIAFVKIRYKLPNEDESKLITRPVANADVVSDFNRLPIDYRFAAAVAGGAQLLKHDPYIKSFDYGRAIEIAQGARGDDEFGYRNEFVQLLQGRTVGGRIARPRPVSPEKQGIVLAPKRPALRPSSAMREGGCVWSELSHDPHLARSTTV